MSLNEVRDKNLKDPRRAELKATVKEKGILWAIAAMVEGSIGYHTPASAKIRITQLMEDRYVQGCERSHAVFAGDNIEEIEHDFNFFKAVEERNPERAKRIMQIVEKVSEWKHENQMGFSMLYPTHV